MKHPRYRFVSDDSRWYCIKASEAELFYLLAETGRAYEEFCADAVDSPEGYSFELPREVY